MDFLEIFGAVAIILEDSFKLLPRNGKLMSLITILPILLLSGLFLAFHFTFKYLFHDMLIKLMEQYYSFPSNASNSSTIINSLGGIIDDFRLLLVIYACFLLAISMISLLYNIAIIVLSAVSYSGKTVSCKDLLLQVMRSLKRAFITTFYTTLLALGYHFLFLAMAIPLLIFCGKFLLPITVFLGVAAHIFHLYLAVVWVLAVVISVIEESSNGIQALGKAERLLKEKYWLHSFILNISFSLLSLILFLGFTIIGGKKWIMANQTVVLLLLLSWSCLVKMFQLVAYTVLYFHCKKYHGEEIELQGSVSYTKLSTEPALSDAA